MAHTQVKMKKLLKSLPLRDRVYESLRKELFDGNFAPGQRITEQEIAVSLGVSRTPVREALNLFRKQGILEQSHGGAYIFSAPTIKQVEDIFEIRRALEPLAARKAVKSVARQMFNICKI
jgi:DNA-binding GntR family transcriptional regulator